LISAVETTQPKAVRGTAHGGAISIDDVVKIYDPDGAAVLAVDHCSLEIEAGEICMIVGPSGCGKTTLLNAIAGFQDITSGSIHMDGELLCGPGKPMAEPGSDRIVVFQNGALFPWRTNLDNVIFGPVMQGTMSKAEAVDKARGMMADAGLNDVEYQFDAQKFGPPPECDPNRAPAFRLDKNLDAAETDDSGDDDSGDDDSGDDDSGSKKKKKKGGARFGAPSQPGGG